jgi:hypothetical protein
MVCPLKLLRLRLLRPK